MPASCIDDLRQASTAMAAPDAAITTVTNHRLGAVRVTQTTTSMRGNIPPAFSSTATTTTPGGTPSKAKATGWRATPPAASAQGTRPARAHSVVSALNEPSSPNMATRAVATAAADSIRVVDRRSRASSGASPGIGPNLRPGAPPGEVPGAGPRPSRGTGAAAAPRPPGPTGRPPGPGGDRLGGRCGGRGVPGR